MSGARPEILFPLFAALTGLNGIGPKLSLAFEKAEITAPRDLLFVLPHSMIDRRLRPSLEGIEFPSVATVEIEVIRHEATPPRGRPYRVQVQDAFGVFMLVFFNPRGDWLRQQLPAGERRIVSGKVELFDGIAQMVHPDHILRLDQVDTLPEFEPVYPLNAGITQRTMFKAVRSALERAPELAEWMDSELKKQRGWPDWNIALEQGHAPRSYEDVSPNAPARQRLAYDELFAHQTTLAIARAATRRSKGRKTVGDARLQKQVLAALPYTPTTAQSRSVAEIHSDMAAPLRMNRLLQGDVGAGKTLVALLSMLAAVEAGGQAAMMAPTEILARQHLAALEPLVSDSGIRIEVLTGRDKGQIRKQKLEGLASGEINILVGTHALFQKDVLFQDLRLAVVDEQHKFGVRERLGLSEKGSSVDTLVMTATPIPRSLELAHYGDMDVSVLDEKPPGRKPIETAIISSERLEQVFARLGSAIAEGRQIYWVCPLVEESEVIEATAAQERVRSLRKALGEEVVGLVHGQMPVAEKDAAMAKFVAGDVRVLVATTVIEVGVDVPNASIMVVEGAQKFGLAQLHQLRGRVGRGEAASICLLIYDPPLGETSEARLTVMRETEDGFRIAEEDLKLRGAGDVLGVSQSGLPQFRIADLESQSDLMKLAQKDARRLLETDPDLTSERGEAVRTLLYLMGQDQAFRYLSVG